VNGFERASDPWVTFNADGTKAFFMALVFNQSRSLENGMTVSRSTDGGANWDTPKVLKYDANFSVLNDKNSMTGDRFDANNVYAIWDRLVFPNERSKGRSFENAGAYYGPTWFTRTTNGGDSWEPARKIWDPGQEHHNSGRNDQSIGNQIVQTGTGDLVDIFDWINNDNGGANKGGGKGYKIAALRSTDQGQTWSNAILVSRFIPGRVFDPTTGAPVRTGDIIPEIAYDPREGSNTVYAVWQGASASSPSSLYFSRSTNGGQTWSTPIIVNKMTDTQAFTPSIRVDKDGRIAINYYDFRNDDASAPLSTDYWSTASIDGGQTWVENPNSLSGTFDQRTAAVARGYFLGDYAGLSAADDSDVFHAVFGQSTGTPPAHASDIEEADGD
jgi:Neuraminidase (sialidase)